MVDTRDRTLTLANTAQLHREKEEEEEEKKEKEKWV